MAGQHGGARPGAGRKKGPAAFRRELTVEAVAYAKETGTTPLEHMLGVMRDPSKPDMMRLQAAMAAAAYIHPKLSASLHATMPVAPAVPRTGLRP